MPPWTVGFLWRFDLKTGIRFALESGMVIQGTTEVYERLFQSFQFQKTKKERKICKFEMDFKKSVLLLF